MTTISFVLMASNEELAYFENAFTTLKNSLFQNDELYIYLDESYNKEFDNFLKKFNDVNYKVITHPLNYNFGNHKNFIIDKCTCDYIFILNCDEYISFSELRTLHFIDSNIDALAFKRRNRIIGINDKYTKYLNVEYKDGFVNPNDTKIKFFKNDKNIRYNYTINEQLQGINNVFLHKGDLLHIKTIDKQMEQNEYYNSFYRKIKVVVSFTSYEKRISNTEDTIKSLLSQNYDNYKIVLYVDKNCNIPNNIQQLLCDKFEIHKVDDIGPFTKLLPSLKEFPNDVIITCDDDIIYNENFIIDLVKSYTLCPNCIHSYCSRYIQDINNFDINKLPSLTINHVDENIFPEGYGGILYPPNIFDEEIFNYEVFHKYCPYNDDLWFFIQEKRMGIKKRSVMSSNSFKNGYNFLGSIVQTFGDVEGLHSKENLDHDVTYNKAFYNLMNYYNMLSNK